MAFEVNTEVFRAFCSYATVVILKMMFVSMLTVYYRVTRKAFDNPEDVKSGRTMEEKKKLLRTDSDVERTRRCHQNDLENIVPFVVIGLLYSLTETNLSSALLHFRIFVGFRFFYMIAYLIPLPNPSRGLSWIVGMCVTFSMAYSVLTRAMSI
ncbi:microsomal glutathione S-transferase 1-like [Brienomyrus brachyistius]|uniref:microsomal glutathione S-transferase 1-like n=1 Tax=Brienomyrus brachyistius TaxID=42636 RepID=UPI0020B1FB77|nr:microsomal glutathione S-transferase 1-like [Brienomyrus brachyistius]